MDTADGVALAAVQILTAVATGAATAVGSSTGQALSDLIRQRLSGSHSGRAALTGIDADPASPAAAQGLRTEIREALTSDPGFERELTQLLSNPPSVPSTNTNSVVIGSSKVRNSQISLGPLSVSNTRTSRNSLTAIAVALVAVLAMALYGGVHLLTGGGSDTGPKPTQSQARHPIADKEFVSQILPDRGSLPPGWTVYGGPNTFDELACDACKSKDEAHSDGNVAWELPGSRSARFHVSAYTSRDSAKADFASSSKNTRVQVGPNNFFSDSDEYARVYSGEEGGSPMVTGVVLRDTVVVSIIMESDWEYQERHMSAFANMMSMRVKQALAGETVESSVPTIP